MSNCILCGRLTIPPHGTVTAARSCEICDRDTYGVPTPDGLITEPGNRVVFAPGAIGLSLNRDADSGAFTRAGIAWFLKLLHLEGFPTDAQGVEATLGRFVGAGLKVLHESPLLRDLDLEIPADVEEAHRRIEENEDSPERWARLFAQNARDATRAIEASDAREAAYLTMHAVTARAMWLYADHLEEIVWEGYLATGLRKLRELLTTVAANRDNEDEGYWQRLLLDHPLVLSQAFATPMVLHQGQAYVGGKEIDNRHGQVTDFLLLNERSRSVVLVEIKKPMTPLLGTEYRDRVYPPSWHLAGAVNQLGSQRDHLLKHFFSLAHGREAGFDPYDPPGFVIAGDSSQLDDDAKRRSFELYRRSLKDTTILTFDELFARTEALLKMTTEDR